jgi:hypothetical protein
MASSAARSRRSGRRLKLQPIRRGHPTYPVWSYVLLDVDTELGREDRARATFERLAIQGFPLRMGAPAAREAVAHGAL